MRWKDGRRSSNVEDRRSGGTRVGKRRGFGIRGGILGLIIGAGAIYMGVDPRIVMSLLSGGSSGPVTTQQYQPTAEENQLADFTKVVLAETEDTWQQIFQQQMNIRYKNPKLVLFSGQVGSACGRGDASMGPFYCPGDQKVYIDLRFYNDLKKRHAAPGDFAQAYVIAHEVGHHVQNLLGISAKVHQARGRVSKAEANQLSVRQELQADCFAGMWAHHAQKTRQILEEGDIEEALRAASQIGDDTLQRQSRGYVVPESFTHGSAAQRVKWFKTGFQLGDMAACDTFRAPNI